MGDDLDHAVLVKGIYIKGLGCNAVIIHARGAKGHAAHADAGDVGRLLGQQLVDLFYRYVSFNYVAIHDGCMARLEFAGHMVLCLDRAEVIGVDFFDRVPVLFQMCAPTAAAASGRRFVDHDLRPGGRSAGCRPAAGRQQRGRQDRE